MTLSIPQIPGFNVENAVVTGNGVTHSGVHKELATCLTTLLLPPRRLQWTHHPRFGLGGDDW